jgi:hypothetical protein
MPATHVQVFMEMKDNACVYTVPHTQRDPGPRDGTGKPEHRNLGACLPHSVEGRSASYFYYNSFEFNIQEYDKVLHYNQLIISILPHKIIISSLKMLNMSLLEESSIKLSL